MKVFLILASFTFSIFSCYSQVIDNELDQRLVRMYTPSQLSEMKINQPKTLAYLNFYVQHAYEIITDVPQYKWEQFPDISTIHNNETGKPLTAAQVGNLNILQLDIKRKQDQYLTYRIGTTGKVIVFLAPSRILADFNLSIK